MRANRLRPATRNGAPFGVADAETGRAQFFSMSQDPRRRLAFSTFPMAASLLHALQNLFSTWRRTPSSRDEEKGGGVVGGEMTGRWTLSLGDHCLPSGGRPRSRRLDTETKYTVNFTHRLPAPLGCVGKALDQPPAINPKIPERGAMALPFLCDIQCWQLRAKRLKMNDGLCRVHRTRVSDGSGDQQGEAGSLPRGKPSGAEPGSTSAAPLRRDAGAQHSL